MKFIHTSDWHLGKCLDGYSRIKEQELFCNDFIKTVEENDVNMVIIAGDIYDTSNPTPKVEKLFYETVLKLSDNGQRCIVIIPGNNDNSEKLSTAAPLLQNQGVLILENINSKVNLLSYKGFEVLESKDGCIKLSINNEKVTLILIPYISENELENIIQSKSKESKSKDSYSQNIGELFKNLEQNFDKDSINIASAHLKIEGCITTESERALGYDLEVDKKSLPKSAQYTALGHLHKMQRISDYSNAYYSGSPIQYSKEEYDQKKGVYLVDITANKTPDIKEIYFNQYKPIKIFNCNSISEAIEICNQNKDKEMWSYFDINTDEIISKSFIKTMRETLNDIVEIKTSKNSNNYYGNKQIIGKSMVEEFKEFYYHSKGIEPDGELINLFLEITNEEGDIKYETD